MLSQFSTSLIFIGKLQSSAVTQASLDPVATLKSEVIAKHKVQEISFKVYLN
jgi:hypothetical protein